MNNSDSAVTALAAVDRTPATGFVRAPCHGYARGGLAHHGLSPRISIGFGPKGLMCLVAVALASLMMILAISAGFIMTHQDWTEIFSNVPDAWSVLGGLAYTWLPEHAFAESIPYTLKLTIAGSISDHDGSGLTDTRVLATFESDGRTYAAVAGFNDVYILDLSDPYNVTLARAIVDDDNLNPTPRTTRTTPPGLARAIVDDNNLNLANPQDISTFRSDGRTYAAVASAGDGGVEILNLSDPYNITPAGHIVDDDNLYLRGAEDISTFKSDGRTYAVVASASDDGVQILDLTDPYNIVAADDIQDIRGASKAAVFESDGRTYAVVASAGGDGVQILDLSDPYNVTPAGHIVDDGSLYLRGVEDISTFRSDGRTYAAVLSASLNSYVVQILDLSDPYNVTLVDYVWAGGYPTDIEVLELYGRTYAAVALEFGGINIIDLSDPYKIPPGVSGITSYRGINQITSITAFELDGRTYVAVTTLYDGVKILQLVAESDACAVYTADDATTPAIPPEIATANNRFAVDLYRQISEGEGNVFFSPISVYTAFSMVGEAAVGETARQLQDVLGFEPDEELRHNLIAMLMSSLNQQDPCAVLHMANSLWIANRFEPYDSYVDVINGTYMADIGSVDFSEAGKKKTVGLINGWVADKTEDKIPSVLSPDDISNETSSILINAIYFKGSWEQQFEPERTAKDDFWTGTQNVTVDFMHTQNIFGYAGYDEVQVLRMPYDGDRLSMVVILPSARGGLDNLMDSVTAEQISTWLEGMRGVEVIVQIPKFEVRTNYDLIRPLKNMGVIDVFDDSASDLSGMANLGTDLPGLRQLKSDQIVVWIEKAAQSAYVKVNEEGTEAATVTMILTSYMVVSMPTPPILFIADHPFLFLIQDDKSGMILFMGRVSDPSI